MAEGKDDSMDWKRVVSESGIEVPADGKEDIVGHWRRFGTSVDSECVEPDGMYVKVCAIARCKLRLCQQLR